MPIMSALGSWRQKDQKLRVSGATWRELVLKKQKKTTKSERYYECALH